MKINIRKKSQLLIVIFQDNGKEMNLLKFNIKKELYFSFTNVKIKTY